MPGLGQSIATLESDLHKIKAEHILQIPFETENYEEADIIDFWWHEDGVLFVFDTHYGFMNRGNIYYNWEANDKLATWQFVSNGIVREYESRHVLVGHHSMNNGIREFMFDFTANGKFIKPWIEQPSLWLLSHVDVSEQKRPNKLFGSELVDTINNSRISLFPSHVQAAINPPRKNDQN